MIQRILQGFFVASLPLLAGASPQAGQQTQDYRDMYAAYAPSIVDADGGHGSGFLLDSRGLIATNHHVVANARRERGVAQKPSAVPGTP